MKLFILILFSIANINIAKSSLTINESKCLQPGHNSGPYDKWGFPQDTTTAGDTLITSPREELDHIYSLLAFAVVFKNWQQEASIYLHNGLSYFNTFANSTEPRDKPLDQRHKIHSRGHNFGAVLTNQYNEVVHWGRNSNHAHCDETQHGETRLIQQYLKKSKLSNLQGHSIYVTGDSCPMCAGMISQQKIKRAILGLSNPFFGKNFDRMNMNTRDCGDSTTQGHRPVPRKTKPIMSSSEIRKLLDRAFREQVISSCKENGIDDCIKKPSQTKFLKSKQAHDLFQQATQKFFDYSLKFPNKKAIGSKKTNLELYNNSIKFLRTKVSLQVRLPNFHKPMVPTQKMCREISRINN